MTAHTLYVALPIKRTKEGFLVAGEAKHSDCAEIAAREAEGMTSTYAGAIAFYRRMDAALGRCGSANLLSSLGEVPKLQYLLHASEA